MHGYGIVSKISHLWIMWEPLWTRMWSSAFSLFVQFGVAESLFSRANLPCGRTSTGYWNPPAVGWNLLVALLKPYFPHSWFRVKSPYHLMQTNSESPGFRKNFWMRLPILVPLGEIKEFLSIVMIDAKMWVTFLMFAIMTIYLKGGIYMSFLLINQELVYCIWNNQNNKVNL